MTDLLSQKTLCHSERSERGISFGIIPFIGFRCGESSAGTPTLREGVRSVGVPADDSPHLKPHLVSPHRQKSSAWCDGIPAVVLCAGTSVRARRQERCRTMRVLEGHTILFGNNDWGCQVKQTAALTPCPLLIRVQRLSSISKCASLIFRTSPPLPLSARGEGGTLAPHAARSPSPFTERGLTDKSTTPSLNLSVVALFSNIS